MTPTEAARRWAKTWNLAWEDLDPEPIVALYAAEALLSTEPFREPYQGRNGVRSYVTWVFGEEEKPQVRVAEPIVDGAEAAIAWWASLREEGANVTLAGTSLLRFDAEGLVIEQWDTWNVTKERRQPPTGWGPFAGPPS